MNQLIILLKKDLMELFRTKKFLIILILLGIFALTSPLFAKMTPEILKLLGDDIQITMLDPTIVDSYIQFVGNLSQMGIFAFIIAFSGLIVNERKKGLLTNLLNNGVTKANFILSKVISQKIIIVIIFLISIILFEFYNLILFEEMFPKNSIISHIALFIYFMFIIAVTNFFSTISKSKMIGLIMSFLVVFSIMIFDLVSFGKYLPNYLLSISIGVLGDGTVLDYAYINMGITLAISLLLVILSIKMCKNKE